MKIKRIPINSNKIPTVKDWQISTEEFDLTHAKGIGAVCGRLSGNLECIDMDLKYDLSNSLKMAYFEMVEKFMPGLLKKLVIQRTRNNGLHLIYRCEVIENNHPLASRRATLAEISENPNAKVKVLIETRGEGGYFCIAPTEGYEILKSKSETVAKTYDDIPEITPYEREVLHTCARSFNLYVKEEKPPKQLSPSGLGITPWDDYNMRGDVIGLLEKHGWKIVSNKGPRTFLLRPGQTDSLLSADFHHELNLFKVFSSSTQFDVGKGYSRYAVYTYLEHNGDFSEASKALYKDGFGDRFEKVKEVPDDKVGTLDDLSEHLSSFDEAYQYLLAVKEDKIQLGYDFGFPELDEHYRFKRGNLIMINGIDNVGKTTVILYLMSILAHRHGFKFLIYTTENTHGSIVEDIIGFKTNKKIKNLSKEELDYNFKWVSEHFIFVKLKEKLYTHTDILKIAREVHEQYGIDAFLIDPWYSVLDGDFDHGNGYKVISDIKLFAQHNHISAIINIHVNTTAARFKDQEGNVLAPGKADTEGGQKFANVADEFLTIHRLVNNKEQCRVSQIHVRKVKVTKTGGRVTPFDEPIALWMNENGCGFSFYNKKTYKFSDYFNPIPDKEESAPF